MRAFTTSGLRQWLPALLGTALALPALAQTGLTNTGVLHVAAGSTLYVRGNVTNAASATLSGPGTLHLAGNLTNAGSLAPAGTLRFDGPAPQTLVPGANAAVGTLAVATPTVAGTPGLTVTQNLTVNTLLTLSGGLVRTDPAATISLPATATLAGETTGRYVQGNLRATRPALTGPTDFGLGVLLDPNGQALGTVSVTRTAGLQTARASYGTNVGGINQGIDRVWRVEAAQAPTAPVALQLSWLADDDNGQSDFTAARLWQAATANGPWAAVGPATNASSRSMQASPTTLTTFTVSQASSPLPVQLVGFTARLATPATVRLNWATASEANSARFEVERSADGIAFTQVGTVTAAGTSLTARTYGLTDAALPAGSAVLYYRLRQVDLDGTAAYSAVRTVALGGSGLALYPNPTHGTATLAGAAPGTTVRVLDALGRVVATATTDATGTAALSGLATGLYVVQAGAATTRLTVE
ncbi:MAG: T9SS type A sorting domain-containing protein [Janthinobacterium lividum]